MCWRATTHAHKTLATHNFISPFSLPLDSDFLLIRKLSDWVMAQLDKFLVHDCEQRSAFSNKVPFPRDPLHHNDSRILGKVKTIDLGASIILLTFTIAPTSALSPWLWNYGGWGFSPLKDLSVGSESGTGFQLTWVKSEGLIHEIYSTS